MQRMMRTSLLVRGFVLSLAVLGMSEFDKRAVSSAQFLEDFGHIGTLKMVKGQVRDSIDTPIPHATLRITNLGNDGDYVVTADESGNFIKPDLPSGKYRIRVEASASNIAEFTARISQGSPFTSGKYLIVKLSPGCASGDSGVSLVSKLKKQ
jgi:hypothetical protein